MIAILGLLLLIVAVLVAVAGVAANTGTAHPLGGDFTIAGLHLNGLSTGTLFLYGVTVGAVAMLGLSMLLGTFSRRMASRGSQRKLMGSQRETEALRLDHERLTQQLDDERTEHRLAVDAAPGAATPEERADEAGVVERAGVLHRLGHRTGGRS
jgi:hypothetical protein